MSILLKVHLNSWWHGLFDLGSVVNHSCAPNATRVIWKNGISIVVATEDVPAGSEITVAYGWSDDWRYWRRLRLFEKYGFWCKCGRCLANEPARPVLPAATADLIAACETDQVVSPSGLSLQAVTLFELASEDRGGNEAPRSFARVFVRCQLTLEEGEEIPDLMLMHLRSMAPKVGANVESVDNACRTGKEEIAFADAIGPIAEVLFLINVFRCGAMLALLAALGFSSALIGEELAEAYEGLFGICAASAAAGIVVGAACWLRRPFGSAWHAAVAAGALGVAVLTAGKVEATPSPVGIAFAVLICAVLARATAVAVARLSQYDDYLSGLARGDTAVGARLVR